MQIKTADLSIHINLKLDVKPKSVHCMVTDTMEGLFKCQIQIPTKSVTIPWVSETLDETSSTTVLREGWRKSLFPTILEIQSIAVARTLCVASVKFSLGFPNKQIARICPGRKSIALRKKNIKQKTHFQCWQQEREPKFQFLVNSTVIFSDNVWWSGHRSTEPSFLKTAELAGPAVLKNITGLNKCNSAHWGKKKKKVGTVVSFLYCL